MRITYDRDTDAATIYLLDHIGYGGAPRSIPCDLEDLELKETTVILLLSNDSRLVGIEVLGASKRLPAELLKAAEPPTPPY